MSEHDEEEVEGALFVEDWTTVASVGVSLGPPVDARPLLKLSIVCRVNKGDGERRTVELMLPIEGTPSILEGLAVAGKQAILDAGRYRAEMIEAGHEVLAEEYAEVVTEDRNPRTGQRITGGTVYDQGAAGKLPRKRPGEHRWIAAASYSLTSGQASAATQPGTRVNLDHENRLDVGVGCIDCEQPFDVVRGRPCEATDEQVAEANAFPTA